VRILEIWIATSSGTPQMQTCRLLLVLGGVLTAKLVQGIPPHQLKPGQPVFRESPRAEKPFVPVNCAGLPEDLAWRLHDCNIRRSNAIQSCG
jgi:hypothetical protein